MSSSLLHHEAPGSMWYHVGDRALLRTWGTDLERSCNICRDPASSSALHGQYPNFANAQRVLEVAWGRKLLMMVVAWLASASNRSFSGKYDKVANAA